MPQVGNKKDLDAEREVTFLEASRFAQENELMFLETSAMTGEHIEEAFLKCSNTILAKIETGQLAARSWHWDCRRVCRLIVLGSGFPGLRFWYSWMRRHA